MCLQLKGVESFGRTGMIQQLSVSQRIPCSCYFDLRHGDVVLSYTILASGCRLSVQTNLLLHQCSEAVKSLSNPVVSGSSIPTRKMSVLTVCGCPMTTNKREVLLSSEMPSIKTSVHLVNVPVFLKRQHDILKAKGCNRA